jgi:hypothetical protein
LLGLISKNKNQLMIPLNGAQNGNSAAAAAGEIKNQDP